MKKLTRSKDQVMLAGVLGGIAEYANLDVTIVRLLYVLITVFTAFFPGLLFYIIAFFVIPGPDRA
jgi:phage shock protein C